MTELLALEPLNLPRDEGGPVFERPWQAQAFALVVELYKAGKFRWPEWVEVFSQEIKASPALPGESANDTYYRQWLTALETMVSSRKLVMGAEVSDRQEEWRQAYLNTPHGQPILLANAHCRPASGHSHDHDHDDDDDDHHHHHHHHHHGHHHSVSRQPVAVAAPLSK